ncbi:MAG: hypothetical protein IPO66_18690 [Rhodanobacteraceae bacterium]|nr:hypothetical protein [Rhodanobacteraceae bacterium]
MPTAARPLGSPNDGRGGALTDDDVAALRLVERPKVAAREHRNPHRREITIADDADRQRRRCSATLDQEGLLPGPARTERQFSGQAGGANGRQLARHVGQSSKNVTFSAPP